MQESPDRAQLPLPPHFQPERAAEVWRVPYGERAEAARAWAAQHRLTPAAGDGFRLALVLVDVQNTFCIPGFELYVGGRSGTGAVDDNRRLAAFIYRNLGRITRIAPTMDTHLPLQIFHPSFLVDERGEHPPAFTLITAADVEAGRWRVDPRAAVAVGLHPARAHEHLLHYTRALAESGKYDLTVWPFHALLGGIGHALVSLVEEAVFFHSIARTSQPDFHVKGNNPLTEHYSVLGPEVTYGADHRPLPDPYGGGRKDRELMRDGLLAFDAVVIAGQAKSHCVAWTIDDLLAGIAGRDRALARRVYLLEDCTSPVVVPGGMDFSEPADRAFERFADAGMHVVRSTDPVASWPGIAGARVG